MRRSRSLLQPHAGQIVGILRMLGLDEKIDLETSNVTSAVDEGFSKDEEIDSETSNMTSAVDEVFSKDEEIDSETSNVTSTDGKLCRI